MKPTTYLLIMLMWSSACNKELTQRKVPIAMDIYVVADTTDPHLLYPTPDAILSLYGLDNNKDMAATFRFTCITDRRLNEYTEYCLADGLTTEAENEQDDPQYREKLVLAFYDSVRASLTAFTNRCGNLSTLQHSECYRTIVGELRLLSESKATKKILLIYSDLQENSDLFNCYDDHNQQLMLTAPAQVAGGLDRQKLMPKDLSGVYVFFVFKPGSRQEDKIYLNMLNVYKLLLESRGAFVCVQANNNFFNVK